MSAPQGEGTKNLIKHKLNIDKTPADVLTTNTELGGESTIRAHCTLAQAPETRSRVLSLGGSGEWALLYMYRVYSTHCVYCIQLLLLDQLINTAVGCCTRHVTHLYTNW